MEEQNNNLINQNERALIIDTRQQAGKHNDSERYFDSEGIKTFRSKIPFGDYTLAPDVSIDTKKGFGELVKNFCSGDRDRVKREIMAAREMGTTLIFLVEDAKAKSIEDAKNWKNPHGKVSGETLYKTLDTFSKRYGVRFEFCKPKESGKRIWELLHETKREDCSYKIDSDDA